MKKTNMNSLEHLPKIRGTYRENAEMSRTNWFSVGGKAEILFKPKDLDDLQFFLKNRPLNLPIEIIGVGSNLLVRDAGIKGVVIKLGREFTKIELHENEIHVGAACLNVNLVNFCLENSVSGLEFLIGIPGSIGGALAMNSGCYGSDVSEHLVSCVMVDLEGNLLNLSNAEMNFSYRSNGLKKKVIFTKAIFKIQKSDKSEIKAKIDEITTKRENSQPIRKKTGGSTFKNPEALKAWQLIDDAGCRGLRLNGAMISEQHCNFMINENSATAADLEELGEIVRKKVKEKTGVSLEWEIKIIGEKS